MFDMEQQFFTIKMAAAELGVSTLTLRNWDRQGKLMAYRHPINNYRMYKKDQIDDLKRNIKIRSNEPRRLRINVVEQIDES